MASYEGLPFVSSKRLLEFTARWERADQEQDDALQHAGDGSGEVALSPSDDKEVFFPRTYFVAQETTYHTLLELLGEISWHLDYWLDWTTPTLRRPKWAYRGARRTIQWYYRFIGRREFRTPAGMVQHLKDIQNQVWGLIAFIQMKSFDILSRETATPQDRSKLLHLVGSDLLQQTTATHRLVAALAAQPRSTFPLGRFWIIGRNILACLWDSCFHRFSPERTVETTPREGCHDGSEAPESSVGELPCASPLVDARISGSIYLHEACLAMETLHYNFMAHLNEVGRPPHIVRFSPIYASIFLAGLSIAGKAMFDWRTYRTLLERFAVISKGVFFEWVREPIRQFCSELLRRNSLAEEALQKSLCELKEEEAALSRMLEEFARIVNEDGVLQKQLYSQHASKQAGENTVDLATRYFETSLNNPISNLMNGHLAESCMVQCQRMKVLLNTSLHSIDTVLVQLKWDFLMAGVMPGVTFCWMCLWGISSIRKSHQLRRRREMVRALKSVHRYLNRNSHALASWSTRRQATRSLAPKAMPSFESFDDHDALFTSTTAASSLTREPLASEGPYDGIHEFGKVGAFLSELDRLCRLASRMRLEGADWRAFRRDVLDLASPEFSVEQKLHTVSAMRSTYSAFFIGAD